MKGFFVLTLAICLKVRVNAQFHDEAGLNKQKNALKKEEIANRVAENWELNAMVAATMQMQAKEKKAARQRSVELGESTDPSGNPILENKRPILRPIDPRTPKSFGNLFLREDTVDENIEEIYENLTPEEMEMIDSLENEEEDDIEDELMLIDAAPRGVCGRTKEEAEERCGNTCDPDVPYCVRYAEDNTENFIGAGNKFKYFDKCWPNVKCVNNQEVLNMASEGGDCAPLRMNNPCPNPCDCYKSKNKKRKCKNACAQTDNFNILKCARLKAKGEKKRQNKIIRYLDLNRQACDFNVYFNHALQDHAAIQEVSLPGLFGTH